MTPISVQLREAVVRRAENRCEYCHLSADSQDATFPVDHIQSISLSGLTEFDNLALACPRCNAKKWKHVEAKDPMTGRLTLLFNPRIHVWSEHFCWSEADQTLIEPISAIGRTTLDFLDLNSAKHLTIRSLLKLLDLHPPIE